MPPRVHHVLYADERVPTIPLISSSESNALSVQVVHLDRVPSLSAVHSQYNFSKEQADRSICFDKLNTLTTSRARSPHARHRSEAGTSFPPFPR
jgi:hypothetical protein